MHTHTSPTEIFQRILATLATDISGKKSTHVIYQFSHSVMSNSSDPIDYSMPGLPVHHQLPELAQTHVHLISAAIHPSHPLLSPSPPAFNLSQYHGLFQ